MRKGLLIKMNKELIICVVIIILIIVGNAITQNYTRQNIQDISTALEKLEEELIVQEINWNNAKSHYYDINKKWKDVKNIMSYFIEHDELEKVETNLVGLNSFIDMRDEKEAVAELNRAIFVLKHIEDKNNLNLRNIF